MIGRRQEPEVRDACEVLAEALVLTAIQKAQEVGLKRVGKLGHLVEEERSQQPVHQADAFGHTSVRVVASMPKSSRR